MKKINAEIIADSLNPAGDRCTTFVLTYPRIIHAEVMTHRMFSRNAASSRAIPFKKMCEMVESDPFIPIAFQKDHSGMQGSEYMKGGNLEDTIHFWKLSANNAVMMAKSLHNHGVTKQLCNRLLEPFLWYTCIVTVTQTENFFNLRCPQYIAGVPGEGYKAKSWEELISWHSNPVNLESLISRKDDTIYKLENNEGAGEIHIMELAERMYDSMNESTPKELKKGEWHVPFGDKFDESRICELYKGGEKSVPLSFIKESKIKIAAARCARVSYENFDGTDDYEKDIALFNKLSSYGHASPFEHCAQSRGDGEWSGNFKGFTQLRKIMEFDGKLQTSVN